MRKLVTGFGVIFGAAFLGFAGLFGYTAYKTAQYENTEPREVTAKVVNTGMIVQDGKSISMIYTDKGTFMNFDDPLKGKFNDAIAIQGQIRNDSTYKFNIYGFESDVSAIYPNILSVVPARTPQ